MSFQYHSCSHVEHVFTKEQCELIKRQALQLPKESAAVGNLDGTYQRDHHRRSCQVQFMDRNADSEWIYDRIDSVVKQVNRKFWQFDLKYIESLQFTTYNQINDHYNNHLDMNFVGQHYRKLTFTLQLTDPDHYQGCDLELILGHGQSIRATRAQGSMTFFPAFIMHRVTELTGGARQSLVGWVCGPQFR